MTSNFLAQAAGKTKLPVEKAVSGKDLEGKMRSRV